MRAWRPRPGARIVEMVWEDLKPRDIVTAASLRQRDHRGACARRLDQRGHPPGRDGAARRHRARPRPLRRARAHARRCSPTSGPPGKYLMEDFYYAGGLRALLRELGDLLDARRAHGQRQDARREHRRRGGVQRRRDPAARQARWWRTDSLAVLRGNLAPDGAVIKPAAAEPHLLQAHRAGGRVRRLQRHGRAHRRPRAAGRPRTRCSCCKNAGPLGAPGMPEWGQLPIPKKLLEARRARHGAHLRCAHERHELRRVRAARRARVVSSAGRSRSCRTAT